MTDEQWDKTSWWLQRTYLEGLQQEGILGQSGAESGPAAIPGTEPAPDQESTEPDLSLASFADLRSMGLTVIEGGLTDG